MQDIGSVQTMDANLLKYNTSIIIKNLVVAVRAQYYTTIVLPLLDYNIM